MNTVRISEFEFGIRWGEGDKAKFNRGYREFWQRRGMSVPGEMSQDIKADVESAKESKKRRKREA